MRNRYSVIAGNGLAREMVLLKSLPCIWGKCSFCDYIADNSEDVALIDSENLATLDRVTGKLGVLDVINSGSIFELPERSMNRLRAVVRDRNIEELFVESHWWYRRRFAALRASFAIPLHIRVGIETFDAHFRNEVLRKGVQFANVDEVRAFCDAICLLVGIKGQTREMIARDVELLTANFSYGAVNIFTANTSRLEPNHELAAWFLQTYGTLAEFPGIDVLASNLAYGVNA
ncbi:MAG: radical SAM protein [Desulfopila sp.]